MSRTHRHTPATPKRLHWPETTARHCYDWLTPEEVVRHALAAFYACSRHLDRFPDDPTGAEGEFRNGRRDFAEDLTQVFEMRLHDHAFRAGVPGFDNWASQALRNIHPVPSAARSILHTNSDMRSDHDIHRTQLRLSMWLTASPHLQG